MPHRYSSHERFVVEFWNVVLHQWESYPHYAERMGIKDDERWRADCYTVAYGFPSSSSAIECIEAHRANGGPGRSKAHRVVNRDTRDVVWKNGNHTAMADMRIVSSVTITPQEEQMSDVEQPLLIPRTTLIETLKARKAEEEKKRADADAKAATRRQSVLDAVSKLSTDQVTNLLSHYVWSDPDALVKSVDDIVEDGKFVTKALEATPVEGSIEKYVRVLELATNENIEVTPRDPIYPLL